MARQSSSKATDPPRATPREVRTDSLKANPHNPRLLFDEAPMTTLRQSIEKVGVLVPLTVYRAAGDKQYTILDGQRRWICAEKLGLRFVPINEVREPTPAQNIITMFQIHKLRDDWDLMPTALKVGVLMQLLRERRDKVLAELTGLDEAVVVRCKKLLTYKKKYQNMMLFHDPSARIKADFFIELYVIVTDRLLNANSWFDRDYVTDVFLRKYKGRKSGLRAVTDFRKIKQYISVARNAGKGAEISRRFRKFLDDDRMLLTELEISVAQYHSQAKKFAKTASELRESLRGIRVRNFLGEEEMWVEFERLAQTIRRKLADAERRPR